MTDARPVVHRPPADAIRGVLAEMSTPEYLTLLGKSVGAGLAVGVLAKRIPALAVPVALIGGIYLGMEIAAYIAEEDRKATIGPVIDVEAKELPGDRPAEDE